MTSEHTPGPWLDWDELKWLREPQKLLESPANARLIAAAPELLEAAKQARDLLKPEVVKEPDRTIFWALVTAIAKAEPHS